ncbi:hypothetical protein HNQ88_004773 [Aureibacter tunicatorum]|uniref:Uncharacterized protein n=1 Tax=Aureibacter tunicatorum TaxID=866807 RepID=A0AAE3XPI5_9BACT|nr:hypothetical protein [Aureibacter tunicatorum]BDD07328.1 hypothetical protein AUTU_48110 [Aureibacter tunicatorum]
MKKAPYMEPFLLFIDLDSNYWCYYYFSLFY